MKLYAITLVLLPFSTLLTEETPQVLRSSYVVSDTAARKAPTAAEIKKMKKEMKKVFPKGMADAIVSTVKSTKTMDFSDAPELMVKMNYAIEKEALVTDFKDDSFDSARDKREARKEMKEDLKKLKQEYKKELKELRTERQ